MIRGGPSMKRPLRAWCVKLDTFDGFGVWVAKTEAGARGYARRSARAAGYEVPLDQEAEAVCLWPLDSWAATKGPDVGGLSLEVAVAQAMDALRAAEALTPNSI